MHDFSKIRQMPGIFRAIPRRQIQLGNENFYLDKMFFVPEKLSMRNECCEAAGECKSVLRDNIHYTIPNRRGLFSVESFAYICCCRFFRTSFSLVLCAMSISIAQHIVLLSLLSSSLSQYLVRCSPLSLSLSRCTTLKCCHCRLPVQRAIFKSLNPPNEFSIYKYAPWNAVIHILCVCERA